MRKLLSFLSLIFSPLLLNAQTFSEAPKSKKPIKQIIEWTTFAADESGPEETIKDAVYTFRKDGQLEQWVTNNTYDEVYNYAYDQENRLVKVTIENDGSSRTIQYQYFTDRRMAEIQERDADVRNIQYFNNKGKVIEEKSFWKGELTEGKWATMERTVYNYDKNDHLFGEMRYEPSVNGVTNRYKTVHSYDPKSGKRASSQFYEADGSLFKQIGYTYDQKGQPLTETTKILESGKTTIAEYLYRDGKIWQTITRGADYRQEKVYKDGRLVRLKEYDKSGKMLWHTDYQYVSF